MEKLGVVRLFKEYYWVVKKEQWIAQCVKWEWEKPLKGERQDSHSGSEAGNIKLWGEKTKE